MKDCLGHSANIVILTEGIDVFLSKSIRHRKVALLQELDIGILARCAQKFGIGHWADVDKLDLADGK